MQGLRDAGRRPAAEGADRYRSAALPISAEMQPNGRPSLDTRHSAWEEKQAAFAGSVVDLRLPALSRYSCRRDRLRREFSAARRPASQPHSLLAR